MMRLISNNRLILALVLELHFLMTIYKTRFYVWLLIIGNDQVINHCYKIIILRQSKVGVEFIFFFV